MRRPWRRRRAQWKQRRTPRISCARRSDAVGDAALAPLTTGVDRGGRGECRGKAIRVQMERQAAALAAHEAAQQAHAEALATAKAEAAERARDVGALQARVAALSRAGKQRPAYRRARGGGGGGAAGGGGGGGLRRRRRRGAGLSGRGDASSSSTAARAVDGGRERRASLLQGGAAAGALAVVGGRLSAEGRMPARSPVSVSSPGADGIGGSAGDEGAGAGAAVAIRAMASAGLLP